MASLNTQPGSSSAKQHQVLVMCAMNHGFTVHDVRHLVGGSIRKLSAQACSDWIRKFSGKELPNKPGEAPRTRPRAREGIVRMVTPELIDQIERLGISYFDGSEEAYRAWLRKYHGIDHPRMLGTAHKAAQIATALKQMHTRRARTHAAIPTKEAVL